MVQEGLSSRSWERRHSKVQASPSRTAVVFKRWTIVMCKSVNKYNQCQLNAILTVDEISERFNATNTH